VKVLLGIPHSGQVVWEMSQAAWRCSERHEVAVLALPTSLPTSCFNVLYSTALNKQEAGEGVELFAMLHADLAPQGYWLDTLVAELLEKGGDLISAVNIIKDGRRLTSSGLAMPGVPWRPWRRFTVNELAKFPETFNAPDIGSADLVLLHNTGCWVADIRRPVFHEENEQGELRAFFTTNDRVVRKGPKREWAVEVESEDWFFSRCLHALNANTYITRKVRTYHYGLAEMDNFTPGGQDEDSEVLKLWANEWRESLHAGK
jgi:hypothetical protein